MLNRLNWIITSYLTCPLTFGALAMSALVACFMALDRSEQRRVDEIAAARTFSHPISGWASLERAERLHQQAEIEAIDLGSFLANEQGETGEDFTGPGARDLSEILEQFPNLRSVDLGPLLYVQPYSQLRDRLARLDKLEYLNMQSLQLVPGDERQDLAWLARLPKLRGLELLVVGRMPDLSELAKLPHLQSLSLRGTERFESCLPQIATIPHLRTLVIVPPPGADHAAYDPASFAALRSAPELRTVYFGNWQFGVQQNPATPIKADLPGVSVYPARVSWNAHETLAIGMLIALASAVLAYQLAIQFHGPQSRTVPGFVPAQLLVATAWWAGSVGVSAWLLTRTGISAGLALAMAAAAVTALVAAGGAVVAGVFRKASAGAWQSMVMPLWCLMVPALVLSRPWWFELHRQATLVSAAVMTVGCLVWITRQLRPSREMTAEVFSGKGAPLQMSGWHARFLARFWRRGERRIERLRPAVADRNARQRARRLRLGNSPMAAWIAWTILLIPASIWGWRYSHSDDTVFPWSFVLGYGAGSIMLGVALASAMVWVPRIGSLPAESLRPGTDRFRRDVALALASDLAPTILLFASVEALAANLDAQNQLSWAGLPVSFVLFLVLAITGMAALSWAFVARFRWLAICVLVAGVFGTLLGVPFLAAHRLDMQRGAVPAGPPNMAALIEAIQWQLWAPILAAGLIGLVAAHRWATMELAELEGKG